MAVGTISCVTSEGASLLVISSMGFPEEAAREHRVTDNVITRPSDDTMTKLLRIVLLTNPSESYQCNALDDIYIRAWYIYPIFARESTLPNIRQRITP